MNHRIFSKGILICTLFVLFVPLITKAQNIQTTTTSQGLSVTWKNKTRLNGGKAHASNSNESFSIQPTINRDILLLKLKGNVQFDDKSFAGIFFDSIPDYTRGVTIWTYAPWSIWSMPVVVKNMADLKKDDVQLFYWQYSDGTYGAAVPMSGNGCRTTIGTNDNQWGSKASIYLNTNLKEVPAMAIGFGYHPFELFKRLYEVALTAMGLGENLQSKKKMPEPFQYIGWCTWNASNNGKDLNETNVINGVRTFTDNKFPLGFVLVDDGWFQQKDGELQSFQPTPQKFPNEFKHLNSVLKKDYNIKYTGIWHTMDGLWNGIDSTSALGKKFKSGLFTWKENNDDANSRTHSFLKPGSRELDQFWDEWYGYFKSQGFDFSKTDNQVVTKQLADRQYPVFTLAKQTHNSLYKAVSKHFNGAIINCMDMTPDAYLNFSNTAVARGVEDFFPYKADETYDMRRGNAPAHVTQAIYNSIYFSQMVYSDFDMFQTNHPDAVYHALARVLNNGPIYLTDKPGEQNFDILNKMVYHDGHTVHSTTSLMPTEDCLFMVQQPGLFKAFSKAGDKGLLVLYNAANMQQVSGTYKAADIDGFVDKKYYLYNYFSKKGHVVAKNDSFQISLARKAYELVYVLPVKNNFAAIGLVDKYNAPATVIAEQWVQKNEVNVTLYEGGNFKAYALKKPLAIMLNGKPVKFIFSDDDHMLMFEIPVAVRPVINIKW